MATPTIVINSGGSDTQASGAGPATAIFGTAASFSGSVVTLDGSPSLTGVATDGSHVLWMLTTTGRQFFTITAKASNTVTVADAPAGTATGRTWAIGGKRKSLDDTNTRLLFSADNKTGWIVDLQEAGSSYILTSTLSIASTGFSIISSTTNRPTITTFTSSIFLFTYTNACTGLYLSHLNLSTTATTRKSALYPLGAIAFGHVVSDCVFDGFDIAIDGSNAAGNYFQSLVLDNVEVKNGRVGVINNAGQPATLAASECFVHDLSAEGFLNTVGLDLVRCVVSRCASGVLNATGRVVICDSVLHGSTGTSATQGGFTGGGSNASIVLINNIIYGNAKYGVTLTASQSNVINRCNAYGANAGGDRNNFAAGTGDVSLGADPFVNAALNNFTLTAAGLTALGGKAPVYTAPGLVGGPGSENIGPYQSASAGASGPAYFAY